MVSKGVLAAASGIAGTAPVWGLPSLHRLPMGESQAAPQPAPLPTCTQAAHHPVLHILLFGQISYPGAAFPSLFYTYIYF